jgi:hypothetical protein
LRTLALGTLALRTLALRTLASRTLFYILFLLQGSTTVNATILDQNQENNGTVEIDLDHYKPFFRELDLSIFQILKFNLLTIESEPTEEEEMKDPKLRYML